MTQSGHVRIGSDGRIKEMALRAAGRDHALSKMWKKAKFCPDTCLFGDVSVRCPRNATNL